eukprot:3828744-Prorocentrum_lima.AAC.1
MARRRKRRRPSTSWRRASTKGRSPNQGALGTVAEAHTNPKAKPEADGFGWGMALTRKCPEHGNSTMQSS